MKIYNSVSELIGNTPLIRLNNLCDLNGISTAILGKMECFNPASSAKDRIALSMLYEAEKSGKITKGATIIEPTSGNTGIGLASLGTARGYRVILTMPDTMSVERRKLLKAFGAEIILTEGSKGMNGAIEKAKEIANATDNSFIPSQFDNPANPKVHYDTTGPEIWADTDGNVDIFVASVGTGGTLSGTAKYLKEQNRNIRIIAVEPFDSPLLSKGISGPHGIQGIGANFVPDNLDRNIIDEIITVKTDDAMKTAKQIAQTEGILVGISSGATVFAALKLAQQEENKGKTIVAILPDTGERYLSTGMFD